MIESDGAGERPPIWRAFAVAALLVAATLVASVAIVSIWADRQLLDTSSWVDTGERLLADDEIRGRVSDFVADEVLVATQERLAQTGRDQLPEATERQLRRQAAELTADALTTPRFAAIWREANRTAHRSLLRILDEDEGAARAQDGAVVIDLRPAVADLSSQLGIGDLAARLPPQTARLTVFRSDQLATAQDAVRVVRPLPLIATLLASVLYALCLLLARPRRLRALAGIGLSLVAAGAIALVARALAGQRIVDTLLDSVRDREAGDAAWDLATSTLTTLALGTIVVGVLVLVGALILLPRFETRPKEGR